jgi:ABC-2 type transport system ATP-binding protein
VTRLLAEQGHYVSELSPISADLESVFLELTGAPDASSQAAA